MIVLATTAPGRNPRTSLTRGGTSPGMSRSPSRLNGPPIPERSAGPSTGGWGTGPAPVWGPSITSSSPHNIGSS